MTEDEAFTLAVENTAQIEVLRHAVAYLLARALMDDTGEQRAAALAAMEEIGDMPPDSAPTTPEATRFFEAVAAAMPEHAAAFAENVRAVLAAYTPPEE